MEEIYQNLRIPFQSENGSQHNNESALNGTRVLNHDLYDVQWGIILLLSVLYGSISILSVVGNALVIWIISTSKGMQSVTNLFIGNLALADILIGMFTIPFEFQAALLQRWNLPHFMCAFCPFVQIVSVNVSVFTLTAIAIDRHRAILTPFKAKPSKFLAKVIITCIWIISTLLATPIAYALRVTPLTYRDGDTVYEKPFCFNEYLTDWEMQVYKSTLVVLQYVMPLSVISCAYVRMGLCLWGSHAPGNAQDARDAAILRNKKKVKRTAAASTARKTVIKMLVIVVALFGLCWLPLQLYNVLQHAYPHIDAYRYINIIWFCCDWFAMSNSCYNPFIYGIYNEKFKREFQHRFKLRANTWTSSAQMESLTADKRKSMLLSRQTSSSTRTQITDASDMHSSGSTKRGTVFYRRVSLNGKATDKETDLYIFTDMQTLNIQNNNSSSEVSI